MRNLLLLLLIAAWAGAAPANNSAIVGLWSGKMEGLTAVRIMIEEDDGKLTGAALFYIIRRDPGVAPTGSPGWPSPMISPSFDGKTLTFKISHRHAHPPATLNDPPVSFRMELTGPDKAMTHGPEGAALEMVREMQ